MSSGGTTSARIEILRILLIVAIIFVHIPFDDETSPYRDDAHWANWFVLLIRDGFGRLGVPLLSIISGYLAATSKHVYLELWRRKVKTLLIPFLMFNISVATFVAVLQLNGAGTFWPWFVDGGALAWANAFFSVTDRPVNEPLYFLRDLFLCFLFLPVLRYATSRQPVLTIALLAVLTIFDALWPVFLVSKITLAFAIGLALGQRGFDPAGRFALGWWALPALFLIAAINAYLRVIGIPALDDAMEILTIDIAMVTIMFVAAVVCWSLSGSLLASRWGPKLAKAGDFSFVLFLTHQPIGVVAFVAAKRVGLPYPFFYLAVPALCGTIAWIIQTGGFRYVPSLFSLITGKRQLVVSSG